MNKFLLGFAALSLALVGAGCAWLNSGGDSGEAGPIKIGFIAPLTGDAATYGEPAKNIVAMAVEEINAAGGVNGQMLEVIYEDGKCNGKDATSAMNKLVTVDQVKAVIGGFCSGESLAIAPIANQNSVLLFSPGSSSPDLTTEGGEFFFRNYPSDSSQAKVLADAAFNKMGWTKVAVLQEQTDYAEALQSTFVSEFEALGGEVMVEKFATGNTDFRTALTKLRTFGPNALMFSVQTYDPADLALKQMNQLGWSVSLIGSDVIPSSPIVTETPELVEGMLAAQFGVNSAGDKFQTFNEAYKAKHGVDVPYASYGQTEYDAVYMLADALNEVGNDGTALKEWFSNASGWEGVSGVVEFDENGDRTVGHKLEVIKGGLVMPYVQEQEETVEEPTEETEEASAE